MVETVRIVRGRRLAPLLPLFPSYVFVSAKTEDERLTCFRRRRVVRMLPVEDQGTLIEELSQIERALEGGAPIDPWPGLRRGRRCRVTSGPFRDLEGTVVRRRQITRLVLSVETLGQAVALEIDAALLTPVD